MPNVLITGAGNVGAAIGREFIDKGYNVIFYDIAEIPVAATAVVKKREVVNPFANLDVK